MTDKPARPSFAEVAAAAFLRRRLHYYRMRAAGLRALRQVTAGAGEGLQIDFDDHCGAIEQARPWLADYTVDIQSTPAAQEARPQVPCMNVVIMIVGSRGDVQPFLPIGQWLAGEGHRVRIATHKEFRSFVEEAGLELYPLGGDPHELMEYMVKTGGRIIPVSPSQIVEDIPKKRAAMAEILESTWRACTEKDPERPDAAPFIADFIIANPPSYGHIHCAEALHVPLHMIFTMPWTPTAAFPHPMTRLPQGGHHPVKNFLSYVVTDLLTWSGIGDLVNEFRQKTLDLPPVGRDEGASILNDNEVPFTYLWPASLVPKPADWGPHIDLANFIFCDLAQRYAPPPDLVEFLAAGDSPIYVGFGSAIVKDPERVTRTIFAALDQSGTRGIVSKGWGHLGGAAPPANVHLIGDCPHDWLFQRCRAVCHHGGAGTTAAGLRAGLPTVIVPFFGDQFFWGWVVADAGAGPQPIPIDKLTSDTLAEAFAACARPEMKARAQELGGTIREPDGVQLVADSLYRHLPVRAMQCSTDPEHLSTIYCETCCAPVCRPCFDAHHAGHSSSPYRYVDWSARAPRTVAEHLHGLIADAAEAFREGVGAQIRPILAPRRDGVILHAGGDIDDEPPGGPVRKRGRASLHRGTAGALHRL